MEHRKTRSIRAFALFALASLVIAACTSSGSSSGRIALTGSDGRSVAIEPPQGGVASVAIFVATECPIANAFAPEIQRIAAAYEPQGIGFFLIYADPDETAETVAQHARDYGYTFPALLDPDHRYAAAVGASMTPEVAVQNAAGELEYLGRINDLYVDFGKQRAQPTRNDLRLVLDALLAGTEPTVDRTDVIGCFIPDAR